MNSFRTILVHLNHESRVPSLVAAAAALARPYGAHVIGLYVTPPIVLPSDIVFPMGAMDTLESQLKSHRDQAERIRAKFELATKGEPFVTEWRFHGWKEAATYSVAEGVIEEAITADLVIASQAQTDVRASGLSDVPERVALGSGRPVLVIPENWNSAHFGTHVTVAWNGRREAARAAFDAISILKQATKVSLLTLVDDNDTRQRNTMPGAEIATTLARHGLNVEIQAINKHDTSAGDALLSQVANDGSDLLVMGAYGHSRLREFILGGVTRTVLKNMTTPVLMSH